mmetsp:Transcript_10025/g.14490  ORF Transcript_10025/g.14490 Transcript_10025/m.14490 type:complete len:390 (+) Transcript_10025:94-1263(+)
MNLTTPPDVKNAIKKLSSTDQVVVHTFIARLKAHVAELEEKIHGNDYAHHNCTHDHDHSHGHGHAHADHDSKPSLNVAEEEFPPLHGDMTSDEGEKNPEMYKALASELKNNGDYEGALQKFNQAVLQADPSALLYGNRADCLLKLNRPRAAIRDCDEALKINPDSAKSFKIRGRAKKLLGDWKGARKDLSESQAIDFDDDAVEDLKFVSEKAREIEADEAKKRLEDAEQLKRKNQKFQDELQQEKRKSAAETTANSTSRSTSAAAAGGMDMPAGMSGMLGSLMSDPELAAGMQNPKVLAAFTDLMQSPGGVAGLMSNPAKLQKLMTDPEVGPFMQKLASKFGPMLGASMAGGMGGVSAMSGMGSHFDGGEAGGTFSSSADDDVPDVPEL